MQLKSSNPKAFETIQLRLNELAGVQSQVGWFPSAKYEDGTPVAYVAQIQELGYPGGSIPARPFMRPTADDQRGAWKDTAQMVSKRVVDGKMTPYAAMDTIALQAEGDVSKKIATIDSPPLSKITLGARKYRQMGKTVTGKTIGEIARKIEEGTLDLSGVSDKPLVDTGHMIATLTHITASKS